MEVDIENEIKGSLRYELTIYVGKEGSAETLKSPIFKKIEQLKDFIKTFETTIPNLIKLKMKYKTKIWS